MYLPTRQICFHVLVKYRDTDSNSNTDRYGLLHMDFVVCSTNRYGLLHVDFVVCSTDRHGSVTCGLCCLFYR